MKEQQSKKQQRITAAIPLVALLAFACEEKEQDAACEAERRDPIEVTHPSPWYRPGVEWEICFMSPEEYAEKAGATDSDLKLKVAHAIVTLWSCFLCNAHVWEDTGTSLSAEERSYMRQCRWKTLEFCMNHPLRESILREKSRGFLVIDLCYWLIYQKWSPEHPDDTRRMVSEELQWLDQHIASLPEEEQKRFVDFAARVKSLKEARVSSCDDDEDLEDEELGWADIPEPAEELYEPFRNMILALSHEVLRFWLEWENDGVLKRNFDHALMEKFQWNFIWNHCVKSHPAFPSETSRLLDDHLRGSSPEVLFQSFFAIEVDRFTPTTFADYMKRIDRNEPARVRNLPTLPGTDPRTMTLREWILGWHSSLQGEADADDKKQPG